MPDGLIWWPAQVCPAPPHTIYLSRREGQRSRDEDAQAHLIGDLPQASGGNPELVG